MLFFNGQVKRRALRGSTFLLGGPICICNGRHSIGSGNNCSETASSFAAWEMRLALWMVASWWLSLYWGAIPPLIVREEMVMESTRTCSAAQWWDLSSSPLWVVQWWVSRWLIPPSPISMVLIGLILVEWLAEFTSHCINYCWQPQYKAIPRKVCAEFRKGPLASWRKTLHKERAISLLKWEGG